MASDRESERAREERERERGRERPAGLPGSIASISTRRTSANLRDGVSGIYRVSIYRVDFELV